MQSINMRMRASGKVFAACGLWMAGLGVYFLFLRPALLPEDPRFMGSSVEILLGAAPGLLRWLDHVFNVMGGFMVASGVLTLLVACRYLANRASGTFAAMALAGGASVMLMSATNFMLQSDFRWLLLVPALLWISGLICYLREGAPRTGGS
jgi:uncharacterized membrane protein YphA (DoxX/SURF4 family)